MDALLTALTNARATSFVDKATPTGLETPEFAVTLKYEDGAKQEHSVTAGTRGRTSAVGEESTPPRSMPS